MRGKFGIAALGALLLSGCFTHDVRDARFESTVRHQEWTSHFFWGLAGSKEVNVKQWCGSDDVAGFGVGSNGATWFLTLITLGIYSPNTVWVDCATSNAKTAIVLDAAGNPRSIARVESGRVYRGVPELVNATTNEWKLVARRDAALERELVKNDGSVEQRGAL